MKILLAVDGSPYTKRMLAYLAAHTELLGAQHEFVAVTVVAPITPHARSYLSRDVLDSYYNDEARGVLAPVTAFAHQQGWNLSTLQPVGAAADVITETAKAGKFDLLVLGSHGHSSVVNLVLGSVVTRVLAQTSVPVLIVR